MKRRFNDKKTMKDLLREPLVWVVITTFILWGLTAWIG